MSYLKPDVVVMDLQLPGMDGVETSLQMRAMCPKLQVVFLTAYSDPHMLMRAVHSGGLGFLLKVSTGGEELIRAIRSVYRGQIYRSDEVELLLLESMMHDRDHSPNRDPLAGLTNRERQVFFFLLGGHTNASIARGFHLSPKTVSTHRTRMMDKLGLRTLQDLLRFAADNGLSFDQFSSDQPPRDRPPRRP
ncbi:MAG: response regulator transcription factor [Caldilineaceae bacterium]|nr:response regulator transcription factor [Caldilineaceae bacterium]